MGENEDRGGSQVEREDDYMDIDEGEDMGDAQGEREDNDDGYGQLGSG